MPPLSSLDRLRSTRTRIAKPRPRPAAAHPRADASLRDWSRHFGEHHPLRAVFVGHNPSTGSWDTVAPYAHGSNRFWRLLRDARLAPESLCEPMRHAELPARTGLGFIDLFVAEGSDASKIRPDAASDSRWRVDFLRRFVAAVRDVPPALVCCVSKVVAKKLLQGFDGDYGRAGTGQTWGLTGLEASEVWVLPSTSGRVGMTNEQRVKPFLALADRLDELPAWEASEGAAAGDGNGGDDGESEEQTGREDTPEASSRGILTTRRNKPRADEAAAH